MCCKCSTPMHLYDWFLSFHWLLELHSNSETLVLKQQRTKSRASAVWGVVTAAAHIHEHTAPPMFPLIPILSCMKQHLLGSCGPVFLWMSPTHNPLPGALDLCLPPSLWCSPSSCSSSSVHPQRRLSPKTQQLICSDQHIQLLKVRRRHTSTHSYFTLNTSGVCLKYVLTMVKNMKFILVVKL